MKRLLVNLILISGSSVIALLICEIGSRAFLNPADYLSVEMVSDPILGYCLPPKVGGMDDWGFRNPKVPVSAEIVTLGDSHTFGNCAKMNEAWPQVVSNLTDKSIYNLGMGGYGPNQYLHLLKTKALPLQPSTILCGLYLGDDFENAYLMTYGVDYWAPYRTLPAGKSDFDIWIHPDRTIWHKKLRNWLSSHSILYRLIVHGPLLAGLKGNIQIASAQEENPDITVLVNDEMNINEAFLPKSIALRLNQDDPRIREGLQITLKMLDEMNRVCLNNRINFLVVIIPTKETVFAKHIQGRIALRNQLVIDKLLASEQSVRETIFRYLTDRQIRYIDPLSDLQNAVSQKLYARSASDMHPGKNGYRAIGQSIAKHLDAKLPKK